MNPEYAQTHGKKWLGMMDDLRSLMPLTPAIVPDEIRKLPQPLLIRAAIQAEPAVRANVDAVVRTFVRQKLTPPVTDMEGWFLRQRIMFGAVICAEMIAHEVPWADFGTEEPLEGFLVAGWLTLLPDWQAWLRRP
jgi:hypothetical protein